MSDRELLERAAKAAGIGPTLCYESRRNCLRLGERDSYRLWRPLTDDGDAFRLAIKLNIHIMRFETMTTTQPLFSVYAFDERDDGDPYAATRRAIVRAAAEIGKE